MLVLSASILLGILILILFFGLNYVRILGAHQQQQTAIEAAALAAARDLTGLVVEDPNCGFVSLSDMAPIGTSTKADDNYYLSVKSINTLLATCRLDMIIADQFNEPVMRQLAQRDYTNTLAAKDRLYSALASAASGGTGTDANGKTLNPVQDAISAYQSNSVRMLGPNKCTLVPGSLKLSLGCITGEPTSTPIPQPLQYSQMSDSQQSNGFYLPYVNVPYSNKDFVFCATGSVIHLVDSKKVQPTISQLPYQVPTIVVCEADETYSYTDSPGSVSSKVVHVKACGEPACMLDPLPASGSLQLGFPNGRPSTINNLQSLLLDPLNQAPGDYVLTPKSNDAPPAVPSAFTIVPGATQHPKFGAVLRIALYDWIRRAATKPNLKLLANGFSQNFQDSESASSPHALYFDFAANGSIATRSAPIAANTQAVVSQSQYLAASGMALQEFVNTPSQASYDLIIKDYCFTPGRMNGGKHAGEPFGQGGKIIPFSQQGWLYENITQMEEFPLGPAAGAVRPTYQTAGVAVELLIQQRN
jgi:hypothetical protein